ncbi:MFS transporter [Alteromonas sp. a30]|uniref:MFS transporter n=1 Tax=Alteromonas sp. a30 TaxID=2730917 RepID=UPI00227E1267|nr:MFS transporter [Alteromonas sp. a30]MCY7296638.1 MFS transporter [Alteromonas sp. a30]
MQKTAPPRQHLPIYLLSCLLAFIGGHIINYSIIFLALERFNSHALAGIGYGLCFGPPLILGWIAGVYCDRYSPRRVILIAQNSYFVSLILLYTGTLAATEYQPHLLLLAAFFSGIGWSFVAPARFATLPFYVSPEKLTGASIGLNLMVMTGFGLAPMILKQVEFQFGWNSVFLTSALLFAFSGALLLPLRFEFTGKPAEKALNEIKASLLFVKKSSFLKALLLLASITYLLMGPMQVVLPSIAEKHLQLSPVAQGNYLSLIAFSLIVGGITAMWMKNKGRIGQFTLLSIALAGVGIGNLSIEHELSLSVLTLIVAGLCGGIGISFIVAGLQAYSSVTHRGRIMSFYSMISQIIPAASGIGAGILAQVFTPMMALQIFSGLIVSSVVLCWFFMPHFRKLERFSDAI